MQQAGRESQRIGRVALWCGLGAAIFLHRPLLALGSAHFSSIDFAQLYSLMQVEPEHVAGNSLLSDPPTQMQPWLAFARAEFAAGRMPFWNPYNGNGAPLLANFQSALFSPFSLPLYVLPWKLGLVVSAWLKLWLISLFTWLFLARVGLRAAACALGAAGFALCGHNVLLLCYPHAGVTAVLPGLLYFIEAAVQRIERGEARIARPLLGSSAVLVGGLYAGHPETYFFCVALAALYGLTRLVYGWRRARVAGGSPPRLLLAWAIVAAASAGMCLPQLLPFFEYLEHSRALAQRSDVQTPLIAAQWPLQVYANVAGNPAGGRLYSHLVPEPNYELANMRWVGPALLVCAVAGLALSRRRLADFFLGVCACWWIYAHDVWGTATLLTDLPLIGIAPLNRSQPVWAFALVVAAACGLDAALTRAAGPGSGVARVRTALALALPSLTLGAATLGAWFLLHRESDANPHTPALAAYVRFQFLFAFGACAIVLIAWLLVVVARAARARAGAAWGVVGVAFLLPTLQWRDYNPITPDEQHFPRTSALEELSARVGADPLWIVGEDAVPPCTNLAYGLRLPSNYDALWVRDHDRLYRELCSLDDNWRPTLRLSELALRLFGARWVLARWDWLPLDSGLSRIGWSDPQRVLQPLELRVGEQWQQAFRPGRANLSSVAVWLAAPPAATQAAVRLSLSCPSEQRVVAELEVAGSVMIERAAAFEQAYEPRSAHPGRWIVLAFEPEPRSDEQAYRLELSGLAGGPGTSILGWRSAVPLTPGPRLCGATGELEGTLVHDYAFRAQRFERVTRIRQYSLYRYTEALPMQYLVESACVVDDALQGLRAMRSPGFDPGACALFVRRGPEAVSRVPASSLLEAARPGAIEARPARPAAVALELDEPCRVVLRATCAAPAVLSTSRTWYPGWRAFVNGEERPVLECNLAFLAVELGSGESRIELVYEPTDWDRSLLLAGVASLVLFVLLLFMQRGDRSSTPAPTQSG